MENLANPQMDDNEQHPQSPDAHLSNSGQDHWPNWNGRSVMRDFLESDEEFSWPPGLGECSGNHCNLRVDKGIPLSFKWKISDKKASIDRYDTYGYPYSFKKPFVVKTIRKLSSKKARDEAANEVKTMKDLRHPHITALLGTFMYQERLSILIFPAACCDLRQFMKRLSKDFEDIRSSGRIQETWTLIRTRSDSTITTDSTRSMSNSPQEPDSSAREKGAKGNNSSRKRVQPLNASFQKKMHCLRSWFVCLSEALRYLHESDVRHKDIKPENILIDESGAVVLTDFGISRKFAKDASHVTNNEWKFTWKYASPEIMKSKRNSRGNPSDVFSLGCVFLEMATLLLGKTLSEFNHHYTSKVNQTGIEDSYHKNLPRVYTWIESLQTRGTKVDPNQSLQAESIEDQDHATDPEQNVVKALDHIRKMLDEDPRLRPKSQDLWSYFQFISLEKCSDCDPRLEERWKPSTKQQEQNTKASQIRRSLILKEDVILEGTEPWSTGSIDPGLLSPRRSIHKRRRFSSNSMSSSDYLGYDYLESTSGPSSPKYHAILDDKQLTSSKNPRPSSPKYHAVLDDKHLTSSSRNPRPSSPKTRGIQQEEDTMHHDGRVSATASPKARALISDPVVLHQNPVEILAAPSIRSGTTSPQPSKDAAAVDRRASTQPNSDPSPPVIQVLDPTRPDNNETTQTLVQESEPSPNTSVIVYDWARRRAYEWPYSALEGSFTVSFAGYSYYP